MPEIVEVVRASPRNALILDGEAIALKPDGSPHSFQVTMRRFGRKLEVEAMRRELPLSVFFFDCLLRDGEALVGSPGGRAVSRAEGVVARGGRSSRASSRRTARRRRASSTMRCGTATKA